MNDVIYAGTVSRRRISAIYLPFNIFFLLTTTMILFLVSALSERRMGS